MDVFDLFAKISLDTSEYEGGLENASEKTSGFSDKLRSGLATAAKVGAAALTAASAAVGALTKASIDNYAEYEQLVGGVDTLFKTSADVVQEYAANAYKTAGLSANEYMETVTNFSASLLQSLDNDTAAAAEKADLAITDMSDNANKMGTAIESIQNAYQGFAKQNFTMLDNLKLGYGGTKEEMERLLEDAEKVSGIKYDISSYADIVDAIHIVQTEMGITGTTALEASTTIQGSVSSMKSAWTNLVTGIATDNADIDVLLDNFLNSVETVADNILPVVERILSNIFDTLAERGPDMLSAAVTLFLQIMAGALKALPYIVASIPQILDAIIDGFIDGLPDIIDVGKQIVAGLWEGIKSMASWIGEKVSGFFSGIVDGAKSVLGIHSPSTVFAGIGGNMALGIGKGWDDEYDRISQNIKSGLDFGTANVDFASSGLGMSSAGIVNGIGNAVGSGFSGDITVNLVMPDGTKFASYLLPSLVSVAKANGTPIVNPA